MYPTDSLAMKAPNVPTSRAQGSDLLLISSTFANTRGMISRVNSLVSFLIGEEPLAPVAQEGPYRSGNLGALLGEAEGVDALIEQLHQRLTSLEARLGVN